MDDFAGGDADKVESGLGFGNNWISGHDAFLFMMVLWQFVMRET